ncbi:MAG: hypothetical protein MZV65_49125 [Chromatiales bacterium]|nr:hypothetical protein [Chromatiales bacterium]
MGGRGLDGLAHALALAFKDAGQPRELAFVRQQLGAATGLRLLAGELPGRPPGCTRVTCCWSSTNWRRCSARTRDRKARAALRLLLEASADAASPVVVLATMRSDFLNAFQLFEGAAERYEEVTLDPMLRPRISAKSSKDRPNRFGLDRDHGLSERHGGGNRLQRRVAAARFHPGAALREV